MNPNQLYQDILKAVSEEKKLLSILIDPDKFETTKTEAFLKNIPKNTTHLFVGGSTDPNGHTEATVTVLKSKTKLPIVLFPGSYLQITAKADALLFLSLLSGRNAEYLVGQHVKAIPKLRNSGLEIISTGYLLIDGGVPSSVSRISNTAPISQSEVALIIDTALAGEYMGAKMIYLEAGSGAKDPVKPKLISEVKKAISIPLIVGGGIRTAKQKNEAYQAGADMVVMGTVFEQ